MRKNSTAVIIYIFGIIFIIGGIVSIYSSINNYHSRITPKYTRIVESDVVSIRVENEWIKHSDILDISQDRFVWYTVEEVNLDGKTLTFNQTYHSEPDKTLTHCLISNDGVNWEINDTNVTHIIASCIIGIICFIFGGGVIFLFGIKRN